MAVLYNFTNVYAIAFAFNAVASLIQNRREQRQRSITDETTAAVNAYDIRGDFVAQRTRLRERADRSVRNIRVCSLITYVIVMIDCLVSLVALIFSGLRPDYEVPDTLFVVIVVLLLALPILTLATFTFYTNTIMTNFHREVNKVVGDWETAGLNRKGVIDISVLALRRWNGISLRRRAKRGRIAELLLRFARQLRRTRVIELDEKANEILSRMEYDYGKEPVDATIEGLAFLEFIARTPDLILVVQNRDGSIELSIPHKKIIDGIREGKSVEEILRIKG